VRFSSAWHRQDWQGVTLARLTLADPEWEIRAGPVYLLRGGQPTTRSYWLMVARNPATGAVGLLPVSWSTRNESPINT
jgi:hypothetical protein